MKNRSGKRAKACDIPQRVKDQVWERDSGRCVVCGCRVNVMPNAHVVSRADGGLGIDENIVTLCTDFTVNQCHRKYDSGSAAERAEIGKRIESYLKRKYPGWSREKVIYKKENQV